MKALVALNIAGVEKYAQKAEASFEDEVNLTNKEELECY